MPEPKVKLQLSLSTALVRRLDYEAARRGPGLDRSALVEALVVEHVQLPAGWVVGGGGAEPPRAIESSAAERREGSESGRYKTTLHLTVLTARSLGVYSAWFGLDRGDVVDQLIREHVTPWDLYDPRESYLTSRRKDRRTGDAQLSVSGADQAVA
jgi:hypothetical protein